MQRIAFAILLALAFSGLSMAVTHRDAMSSGEMPAVACLEHCLQTPGAVGGKIAAPAFWAIYLAAALGMIGNKRLLQAFSALHEGDPNDKLLLKRKLATVVLRN